MELNFKEVLTASMVLFAVIDIIGSIPIIIDLRQKVGHIQSEKASIVAMLIMILFLFVGVQILNLIGIDVYSFAVAGSFVMFFLALEMILGVSLKAEFHTINIIIAIVVNSIFVYAVLKSSTKIERFIGKGGINVVRKIFGVIVMAIAVKLFASNVQGLFN